MRTITVCHTPDGCCTRRVPVRATPESRPAPSSGQELLAQLRALTEARDLQGTVRLRTTECLWGCTYGPRLDVEDDDGRVTLYGGADYEGDISVRGRVRIHSLARQPLSALLR